MYQLITSREHFSQRLTSLTGSEPTFVFRDNQVDTNNPSIEPYLSFLLLLWGLTEQGEQVTTQLKVEAEPWAARDVESTWYIVPVALMVEAFEGSMQPKQSSIFPESVSSLEDKQFRLENATYYLLGYLFDAAAQQLLNDVTLVSSDRQLISRYEAQPKTEKVIQRLTQLYLEKTDKLVRARRTLEAMLAIQQASQIAYWLNRVVDNEVEPAQTRAIQLYLVFLKSMERAEQVIAGR